MAQLEQQLAALGPLQHELPQAQFVALAGAMHSGDYTATVHLLHRYYDYSQAGAGAGTGASLAAPGSVGTHYQSGLLSLTSAQAAFGHVESALLVRGCCWRRLPEAAAAHPASPCRAPGRLRLRRGPHARCRLPAAPASAGAERDAAGGAAEPGPLVPGARHGGAVQDHGRIGAQQHR